MVKQGFIWWPTPGQQHPQSVLPRPWLPAAGACRLPSGHAEAWSPGGALVNGRCASAHAATPTTLPYAPAQFERKIIAAGLFEQIWENDERAVRSTGKIAERALRGPSFASEGL